MGNLAIEILMNENADKNIPLAGVIGDPISHSRSPEIHNYWLKAKGVIGHYIPLRVSTSMLSETIKFLPRIGFKGVNITIPHKTNVISLVDNLTDRAALIGAVNTIHFNNDGNVTGDNTDAYGFIENIKQTHPTWTPNAGPAMVFGAGGAARAVVWALLSEGVPEVRVVNRTKPKALALSDVLGAKVKVIDWMEACYMMNDIATLVNTTSLGMVGNVSFNQDISQLNPLSLVIDLVYNPLETDLIKSAKGMGLTTVDGLGMLLHQAIPGFEKWFGYKPEVTMELKNIMKT